MCGTIGFRDASILDALGEVTKTRKMEGFEPQHLALSAWSFAVLVWKDDQVLGVLAEVALQKIQMFGSADGVAPCQEGPFFKRLDDIQEVYPNKSSSFRC